MSNNHGDTLTLSVSGNTCSIVGVLDVSSLRPIQANNAKHWCHKVCSSNNVPLWFKKNLSINFAASTHFEGSYRWCIKKKSRKVKKNTKKPRKPYFDFLWYITLIYCELWYLKIAIENQDFKSNSLPSHNISILDHLSTPEKCLISSDFLLTEICTNVQCKQNQYLK